MWPVGVVRYCFAKSMRGLGFGVCRCMNVLGGCWDLERFMGNLENKFYRNSCMFSFNLHFIAWKLKMLLLIRKMVVF